jgi:hypothetical protein
VDDISRRLSQAFPAVVTVVPEAVYFVGTAGITDPSAWFMVSVAHSNATCPSCERPIFDPRALAEGRAGVDTCNACTLQEIQKLSLSADSLTALPIKEVP